MNVSSTSTSILTRIPDDKLEKSGLALAILTSDEESDQPNPNLSPLELAAIQQTLLLPPSARKDQSLDCYTCSWCGKTSNNRKKKLPCCARCYRYAYCNTTCQRNHWKKGGHKNECIKCSDRSSVRRGHDGGNGGSGHGRGNGDDKDDELPLTWEQFEAFGSAKRKMLEVRISSFSRMSKSNKVKAMCFDRARKLRPVLMPASIRMEALFMKYYCLSIRWKHPIFRSFVFHDDGETGIEILMEDMQNIKLVHEGRRGESGDDNDHDDHDKLNVPLTWEQLETLGSTNRNILEINLSSICMIKNNKIEAICCDRANKCKRVLMPAGIEKFLKEYCSLSMKWENPVFRMCTLDNGETGVEILKEDVQNIKLVYGPPRLNNFIDNMRSVYRDDEKSLYSDNNFSIIEDKKKEYCSNDSSTHNDNNKIVPSFVNLPAALVMIGLGLLVSRITTK